MKKIDNVKDAFIVFVIGIVISWCCCPIVAFSGKLFSRGTIPYGWHWKEAIITSLALTLIDLIIFVVFIAKKSFCRSFQVEIYTVDKLKIDDFLAVFKEEKKTYIFEYMHLTIFLKSNEHYSYAVVNEEQTVKMETFSTFEEFMSAKIVSGETLSTLWDRLDFVCCDSVVREL